jgi:hypothetical protein
MPKKLMLDIFRGYHQQMMDDLEPTTEGQAPELQPSPTSQAVMQAEEPTGAQAPAQGVAPNVA